MNNEPCFNYGDVVRLKKDLENTNLKAGDYGIIWAVYDFYVDESKTVLGFDYEGSFWDNQGNYDDAMFDEEDAEKVLKLEEAAFSEDMKGLWLYINQK
jgi:hypothetical protein